MISRRTLSPLDYRTVAAEVMENLWYSTVAGLTLTLILGVIKHVDENHIDTLPYGY